MSQKPLHPCFSLSFFLLLSYPFMSHGQVPVRSIYDPSGRSVSGYRPSIDPALRKKTPLASPMSSHKPMVSAQRPASVLAQRPVSLSALPSAGSAVPPKRTDPLDHIPKPLKSFYLPIADSMKPHQYDGSLPQAAHGLFTLYQTHYSLLSPNEADFEAAALAYEAEDNRKKGIQPEAEPESKMTSEPRPTPFIQLLQKEFGSGAQSPLEETQQKLMTIVMGLQSYRDYGFDMLLSKENGRSIVHNLYVMAFGSLSNRLGGENLAPYHSSHSEVFGARSASAAASKSFQDFESPVSAGDPHFQTEAWGLPPDLRSITLSEPTPTPLLDGGSKCSITSPSEPVSDSGSSMLPSFEATDLTQSLLNTDPKPLDPIEGSVPHSAAAPSAPSKTDWIRRLSDASQIDQSFFEQFFALCEEDRTRVRSLISLLLDGNSISADFLSQLVALTPEQHAFVGAQDPSLL